MKNFTLIVFILISNVLFSQSVSVSGSWIKTISASDITEAGKDYVGTYTSSTTQTKISIDPRRKNNTTVISIRKDDGDWHEDLNLQIKRINNGIKDTSGGLEFQSITDIGADFFKTKGKKENVPLQYRINGISVLLPVLLPVQEYTTTIIFTVYDD